MSCESINIDIDKFFSNCFFSIYKMIKTNQPTHALLCLDDYSNSWRKEAFCKSCNYKFLLPQDFFLNFKKIINLLHSKNIKKLAIYKNEAIDIINSLCKKVENKKVVIVGSDQRYWSLLSDQISIHTPYDRGNVFYKDKDWLLSKHKITPEQVNMFFTLNGLKKIGLDGIHGVGEKTAISLIQKYGDIKNLIVESATIEGKIGNTIRKNIVNVCSISEKELLIKNNLRLGITLNSMELSATPPKC